VSFLTLETVPAGLWWTQTMFDKRSLTRTCIYLWHPGHICRDTTHISGHRFEHLSHLLSLGQILLTASSGCHVCQGACDCQLDCPRGVVRPTDTQGTPWLACHMDVLLSSVVTSHKSLENTCNIGITWSELQIEVKLGNRRNRTLGIMARFRWLLDLALGQGRTPSETG